VRGNSLFHWPVLEPKHKFEPRPDVIDGANFYIDHSFCKTDVTDNILVETARYSGSLFRPGDPEHSCGIELCGVAREVLLKFVLALGKEQNEVVWPPGFDTYRYAFGQVQLRVKILWSVDDENVEAFLDSEFFDEWSS